MSPAPTSTTDAVVAVTVIAEVPLWPSLVAVIVAVPTAPPVTSPLPLTLATPVLLLAHVTVRPVSAFPPASFGVAASCTVDPTVTEADAGATVTDATGTCTTVIGDGTLRPLSGLPFPSFGVAVSWTVLPSFTDADAGATVTDATGTKVTVIVAVPLLPSLVAVMVAEPAAAPVTSPLLVTLATDVLLLAQLTARASGLPFASFGVALSCTVAPT